MIAIGTIVKLTSASPALNNQVWPCEIGEVIRHEERDGFKCAVVEFEDVIIHCREGECISIGADAGSSVLMATEHTI